MSNKPPYNNPDFLNINQNQGNDPPIGFQSPPAPPSYDQATGSVTTTTVHITGPPAGHANTAPVYQQQYISGSTCVYTPVQNSAPRQATVITQQPVVIVQQQILPLGLEPTFVTCPSCNVMKQTRVEYEPSVRTHLMAALLCVLGLWCCVCLPYCAGSCMNANHYCGNCNKFLGTYGSAL